jgi:predicted AAA+ superfamily ATPase
MMAKWEPTEEDIERVISEQNPWLATGEVPGTLAPPTERALARSLWARVAKDEPRRYQLILGPRRVGKTTAMYQTVRRFLDSGITPSRLWWFRLDHPFLLQSNLQQLITVALDIAGPPTEPTYFFLDELVYARDWDLWLKTFYDERYPIRIVATSSATAALRGRRLESGVGRWDEQFLMPYTFTEFLDLAGRDAEVEVEGDLSSTIERALSQRASFELEEERRLFSFIGGFPELLIQEDFDEVRDPASLLLESQRILRSDAVERAIYKDIPQSYGVENPLALERLLYSLAGQAPGLISPKRICGELDISQPTFDRYLSYLERAFLVFTLPNYSGREATVQKRGRKLYFVDGAVRNAALQRGVAPLTNPNELGQLLENLVASNLRALALQSQVRLFHWRDGKHEVDLVFDHPDRPLAFEISSSQDHSRKGLVEFAKRFPRFAQGCYLIAPNAQGLLPKKARSEVGTLSVDLFLVLVGRQAERALAERLA